MEAIGIPPHAVQASDNFVDVSEVEVVACVIASQSDREYIADGVVARSRVAAAATAAAGGAVAAVVAAATAAAPRKAGVG